MSQFQVELHEAANERSNSRMTDVVSDMTSQNRSEQMNGANIENVREAENQTNLQNAGNHGEEQLDAEPAHNPLVNHVDPGGAQPPVEEVDRHSDISVEANTSPRTLREWRPWKIEPPWLSFLLAIDIAFITTILTLNFISRRDSGFVELGSAPAFLAHDPAVEQAIWTQGILYTAFPAFIMTVFQTCWDSTVIAFAERQPYVELNKKNGGPARTTILLDYRAEPRVLAWISALKNGHYILAACILSSVTVAFLVVPLTSFLFTTSQFVFNSTFPLSVETAFNASQLVGLPMLPDVQFMDIAVAMHIQGAKPLPWTDVEFAYPRVVPLNAVTQGNATFDSQAYSAYADCVYLEEKDYHKQILTPGDTGIPAITIILTANDRGCKIASMLNIPVNPDSPPILIESWTTKECSPSSGWSRFSFIIAKVTKEQQVSNFSLTSCMPVYRASSGNLTVNWNHDDPAPVIRSFAIQNMSESRSEAIWQFFEMGIQELGCYDPRSNIESNAFGRNVYRIAAHRKSESPLAPEAIADAAQTLFTTMYAIFVSSYLLRQLESPIEGAGTLSIEPTRLIVVSPVAYMIIAILLIVAGLLVALFFYTRQESILKEEPKGLLSAAGVVYKSIHVNDAVKKIVTSRSYDGRITAAALKDHDFMKDRWLYVDNQLSRTPGTSVVLT